MSRGVRYVIAVCLSILLLGRYTTLGAQPANAIHFTKADGLPSNNVYYVFEDSKGFLWFATDAGVARYDGIEFEIFNRADGLTSQDVFQMLEDRSGRIWFATFDGRPCFFENGKIYNHTNTPWLDDLQTKDFIQFLYEDAHGTIWMGGKLGRIIEIIPGKSSRIWPAEMISGMMERDGQQYFINRWMDPLQLDRRTGSLLEGDSLLTNKAKQLRPDQAMGYKLEVLPGQQAMSILMINTDLAFTRINRNGTVSIGKVAGLQGKTLVNFAKLADGETALCYQDGASLLRYDSLSNHFFVEELISLPGILVSHLLELNGSMWVATLGEGVYFLPKSNIRSFPFPGENPEVVDVFHTADSLCLVSGHHNEFGTFSDGVIQLRSSKEVALDYRIHFALEDSLGVIAYNTQHMMRIRSDFSQEEFDASTGVAPVFLPHKGRVYIISNAILRGYESEDPMGRLDSTTKVLAYPFEEGRIRSFAAHNDSTLWVVTQSGLLSLTIKEQGDVETRELNISTFDYEPVGVVVAGAYGDNTCTWVWSNQEVLGLLSNGDSLKLLNDIALPQFTLRGLYPLGDSLLLACSDEGLMVFRIDMGKSGFHFSRIISQTSGLAGEVVNGLSVFGDSVYVATDQGLSVFPRQFLVEPMLDEAPKAFIKELWVDGVPVAPDQAIEVSESNNSILIRHTGIHYPSLGNITFRYRVNGGEWNMLNAQSVHFIDLPAGDYIYEVQARSAFGIWSKESALARFAVVRPFSATNLFYGLIVVLAGLVIAVVVWLRFRQLKQKATLDRRAAEMELRALKAQMNPHFIFNVLGSIQRYMLANNSKLANEYLTKFSRLTRMVLNHSNKLLVPLSDELQAMEYYIALEQLRLSHRFSYQIHVDEALNPDRVEIPPLLLQIFVENAVWHGLSALEENGRLELVFERHHDLMKIMVRDNGIGRSAAMARNPRHGESRGSQIIVDKLSMLNETVYRGKATMTIIDLYDDEGKPSGTEVQFWVPLDVQS